MMQRYSARVAECAYPGKVLCALVYCAQANALKASVFAYVVRKSRVWLIEMACFVPLEHEARDRCSSWDFTVKKRTQLSVARAQAGEKITASRQTKGRGITVIQLSALQQQLKKTSPQAFGGR